MNKQRGFTLLEIILALVIFASCAMMVVSTIPSRSGADIFGQQFKAVVDYGSDRAVMDASIVGMVITTDKYQLVRLDDKQGDRRWVPLSAGRIQTGGNFPPEMHLSLSPQRLAATIESEPQIVFLPDGEIGRFVLALQSHDHTHRFKVVSQGAAPVSVENDE